MTRPLTAGADSGPEPPFPVQLSGKIIKGFGRGSKELGIPTANIPITGLDIGGHTDIKSGIYYGFAGLSAAGGTNEAIDDPTVSTSSQKVKDSEVNVYPMVMSIGWNPYYKNEVRSVEVHIIHKFHSDFYGALLNLSILGFIRDEKDYKSMELLIEDINTDIAVAGRSLDRPAYASLAQDKYLTNFQWAVADSN